MAEIVGAVVVPLVNKLMDAAVLEAARLAGVSNDIDILRDNLVWLQSIIKETSLHCRYDVRRLMRISHEAEDAIDQFLLQVDLSRFEHEWVRAVVAIFANIIVRHRLAGKVAALNRRLDGIIENVVKFKVENKSDSEEMQWMRSTKTRRPSLAEGWDNSRWYDPMSRCTKKQELVGKLLETGAGTPDGNVICVVGESSVGKTAFVRDVCENTEVRNKFAVHVWTSFPQNTSDSMTVQLIYEKLFRECLSNSLLEVVDQHMPYSEVKTVVREALRGKRSLLVLDGPINDAQWKKVRLELPMGGTGSKIVLIAPSWPDDNSFQIYRLQICRLQDDESEELFNNTVGTEEYTRHIIVRNFHSLYIKESIRGLPLVVVLLAKLLKTKEYDKWEDVLIHIWRSHEQADQFWTILSLIFYVLYDELKSCLLYFVSFPENTVIDANQLVRLWIAEGFVRTMNGTVEMEQLGQDYLKELISRGLVQLIKKDAHGHVELVAIHEHIYTYLRSEAHHSFFMEVHHGSLARAPVNVRRLSLRNYNDESAELTNHFRALRSVLCYPKDDYTVQDEQSAWSKMSCCMARGQSPKGESSMTHSKLDMVHLLQGSPFLRVIDTEGIDIGNKLPEGIGDIVHFHYLSFRRCRSLENVPASIGRLTHLQTLDVRETAVRKLPKSFWKIKALRHVLGDELRFPRSAGYLSLLHTLGTVSIQKNDCEGRFGTILRKKMSSLNCLHLVGLNKSRSHWRALEDALGKLALLVNLRLSGEVIQLDFTGRSLLHLQYMQLQGRLEQPEPYRQLHTSWKLTHLELKKTYVKQDFIDMVAYLPVLANLMLLTESYNLDKLEFHPSGFKRLTLLRLSDTKLKKIIVKDSSALQKLVSLELINILPGDIAIEGPDNYRIKEKIKWV